MRRSISAIIIRDVPDLVVLNDEAHHLHDEKSAWFKAIEDISLRLRQKGSQLSAQFDLSATPKHNNGAIFVQTIADYPLVEAIRQGVVKTPVLPDQASRAKLTEKKSAKFTEQYEDYLHLGYLEWKKVYDELLPTGKKSILFVMTDDTRNCDEVAEYLESRYPELEGRRCWSSTPRTTARFPRRPPARARRSWTSSARRAANIDDPDSPYKAIVSVMVLREGWDVQNVVVDRRPASLHQQGAHSARTDARARLAADVPGSSRCRRRSASSAPMPSWISSRASRSRASSWNTSRWAGAAGPKSPIVVEVDRENTGKDIDKLDIDLPVLAPRIQREYKNLSDLDPATLPHKRLPVKQFTAEQQREIVFRDLNTDEQSHMTEMDTVFTPNYQNMIGFFARSIMRDLRLVGGFDVLFGKIKEFVETELFEQPVDLDDLNMLRNLSEIEATRTLVETFKTAINALTVRDTGHDRGARLDPHRQDAALPREGASLRRPEEVGVQQDRRRLRLRAGDGRLPRRLRRHRVVRQEQPEHEFPHRIPERGRRHRQLLPGLHRQADRGRDLDRRDEGPGGPRRSAQVGAAEAVVCRRDRA